MLADDRQSPFPASSSSSSSPPGTSPSPSNVSYGSHLMFTGCISAFTPSPLDPLFSQLTELHHSQQQFLSAFQSNKQQYYDDTHPLMLSTLETPIKELEIYLNKVALMNNRFHAVKKRLNKLRQRTEALAAAATTTLNTATLGIGAGTPTTTGVTPKGI